MRAATTQEIAVNPVTNKIYAVNETTSGTVEVIDGATNTFSAVQDSTATTPIGVAVNPVTNTIFVANSGSSNITLIDGSTDKYVGTINDPSATNPAAIVLNPATSQIYVANKTSGYVSVIDGGTNTLVTSISTGGTSPQALAVNPVINHIYAANNGSGTISVIDGITNEVVNSITPASGTMPVAVAANPATGQVYGVIQSGNSITVFDDFNGFSPSTASDPNASEPIALDVNPVTNMVFVANYGSNNVTAIFGYTNATQTITDSNATNPIAVAVNPNTNLVYVANQGSNNVTVIDGSALSVVTTINVGISPNAIAVNPATNKIYVANEGNDDSSLGSITVIDGATNTTTTVTDPAANKPYALGVNPVSGQIFVPDNLSATNTIISEQQVQTNALQTAITPLTGNETISETPSFTLTATNTLTGNAPDGVFFQVDTWQGPWAAAKLLIPVTSPVTFTGTTAALTPGFHILYAYATDGEEATATITGGQTAPLVGTMAAYGFLVAPPIAFILDQSIPNLSLVVGPTPEGVTSGTDFTIMSNDGGAPLDFSIAITGTYSADFAETADSCSELSGTLAPKSSCSIYVDFKPSTPNNEPAELVVTDNSGGVSGAQQIVNLIGLTSAGDPETLTVTFAGAGSGTVTDTSAEINCTSTCLGSYSPGTVVTLTATPSAGSTFLGWSGACSGTSTCVVTMNSAESVTATFITTGVPTTTNCTGTTINWLGGNGNWSDGTKWTGGTPPNSSSVNVCIDAGNTSVNSQVTLDISVNVGNLYIDKGDTLIVSNDQTLAVAGAISNSGLINFVSAANNTQFEVNGAVTLTGGGTLTMTQGTGGRPYINQEASGSLTNVNNLIQGAGEIGNNGLVFTNQAGGTVDANDTNGNPAPHRQCLDQPRIV